MKPHEAQSSKPDEPFVDCNAETDVLGDQSSDSGSSDCIPDNFMGVKDVPPFDGSDSTVSVPQLANVLALHMFVDPETDTYMHTLDTHLLTLPALFQAGVKRALPSTCIYPYIFICNTSFLENT